MQIAKAHASSAKTMFPQSGKPLMRAWRLRAAPISPSRRNVVVSTSTIVRTNRPNGAIAVQQRPRAEQITGVARRRRSWSSGRGRDSGARAAARITRAESEFYLVARIGIALTSSCGVALRGPLNRRNAALRCVRVPCRSGYRTRGSIARYDQIAR